ncbi:MAG: MFS transporter, partial [Acidimicrobiia bacterium]|nr:MFS transporter [Acidimicrobiia bacterium]
GLSTLLFVASRGSALGWASPATLGLLGLAIACLAAFLLAEGRAPSPLVDLSLLRNPAFLVANALNGLANATMFAIWLFGPTLLVTVRGHGTIPGGALLAVTAAGTAVAAPLAGRLTDRLGVGRLSTIGLVLEAIGLAAASRVGAATPSVAIIAAFGLVGVGLGLFQVPNMSYVMGSIPRSQQGVAGSMTQMVRTAGVVTGVAAANTLFVVRRDAHAEALDVADLASPELFTLAFRDVLVAAALVCAGAAALSLVRPSAQEPAADEPVPHG